MPDIAMCGDRDCPSAGLCYRSPMSGTVPKPHWQNWQSFRREPGAQACRSVSPVDAKAEKRLIERGVEL